MKVRVYVDPGVKACGYAVFEAPRARAGGCDSLGPRPSFGPLLWAGLVDGRQDVDRVAGPMLDAPGLWDRMGFWLRVEPQVIGGLVERMQVYMGVKYSKVNPNDLLDVTLVSGSVGPWLGVFLEHVYPRTWKGRRDKEATAGSVMQALTGEEAHQIEWPSPRAWGFHGGLNHNVIDAVGIGLWHAGRFNT